MIFILGLSFTAGLVGLGEICPSQYEADDCKHIGGFNWKVIVPYAFSITMSLVGFGMSIRGCFVADRLQTTYNILADDFSVSDHESLMRWSVGNIFGWGIIVFIDCMVVFGFYYAGHTWNYSALAWIMFSTHAMAATIFLMIWLPYGPCCPKKKEPEYTQLQRTDSGDADV